MTETRRQLHIGVLALQGAFSEHLQLLRKAFQALDTEGTHVTWSSEEVRKAEQLEKCDALIIPGGESTTIALIAQRSNLLEPLRQFVKVDRKPTWGTCAGLILLAEAANHTKKGGQDLIGGLDVRVNRNHFGRQVESFETQLELPFLSSTSKSSDQVASFHGVFIRAPVVERVLPAIRGVQAGEEAKNDTVVAPSRAPRDTLAASAVGGEVEVMAVLPGRADALKRKAFVPESCDGDIVAVKQGNCFGTSFHPELTTDARIHVWWLKLVEATTGTSTHTG